jgi:hypothetical protein
VYTKGGKDYVKRKKPEGTFGMRQASHKKVLTTEDFNKKVLNNNDIRNFAGTARQEAGGRVKSRQSTTNRGAPPGYAVTSRKDPDVRQVYTKGGKDYVKRKKTNGTFGMRQAT